MGSEHISLALGTIAAPCLLGLVLGILISRCVANLSPGLGAFLAAVGGFLGLLTLAGVLAILDAQGIQTFQTGLKSALVAMFLLSTLIVITSFVLIMRSHSKYELTLANKEIFALGGVVALSFFIVATHIQIALTSPMASWDALTFWYLWAEWYLEFDLSQDIYGRSRSSDGSFPWQHPRHPLTLVRVIAFNNYLLGGTNHLGEWLILWTCVWLLGALLIFGFSRLVSQSRVVACIMAFCYLSMPLVENHHVLAGYAELFIACAVLCATSLIALGLSMRRNTFVVLGMLVAMVPLCLKNIGLLYTASVVLPLILVNLNYKRIKLIIVSLVFFSSVVASVTWLDVVDPSALDLPIYRDPATGVLYVSYAGYELSWSWTPLLTVVTIQVWVFLINGSFSVVAVIAAVALIAIIAGPSRSGISGKPFLFVLLSAFSLFAALSLPLFVERYAMIFGIPGSDLGNSRFSLPFAMVVLLLVPFLYRIVDRSGKNTA